MTRWCAPGKHAVADHEAQIISGTETGSGPATPTYGCHEHVRNEGIVPQVAFIGRRDAAPVPPAGRAS
jgi:hypothetical protein